MVVILVVNLALDLAAGLTGEWWPWWSAAALLGWGLGVAIHGPAVRTSRFRAFAASRRNGRSTRPVVSVARGDRTSPMTSPPRALSSHLALSPSLVGVDPGVVERIVATYFIDGHEVDVVEMLDDDGAWFELAIDGAILPDGGSFTAVPSEAVITDVLHRWHATAA